MEFNDSDFEIINFYTNPEKRLEFEYKPYSEGTMGFYQWQFNGAIVHKPTGYSVTFSDTPSGCGPVQIYRYRGGTYNAIDPLCKIIPYVKHLIEYRKGPFGNGATALTFVQGNPSKTFVEKAVKELGASVKLYYHSRHDGCREYQGFFYINTVSTENKSDYRTVHSILKSDFHDMENVEILE